MIRAPRSLRHSPHDDYDHGGPEDGPTTPLPPELWAKAEKKHPKDADARQAYYLELMVDAGHVVLDT